MQDHSHHPHLHVGQKEAAVLPTDVTYVQSKERGEEEEEVRDRRTSSSKEKTQEDGETQMRDHSHHPHSGAASMVVSSKHPADHAANRQAGRKLQDPIQPQWRSHAVGSVQYRT